MLRDKVGFFCAINTIRKRATVMANIHLYWVQRINTFVAHRDIKSTHYALIDNMMLVATTL